VRGSSLTTAPSGSTAAAQTSSFCRKIPAILQLSTSAAATNVVVLPVLKEESPRSAFSTSVRLCFFTPPERLCSAGLGSGRALENELNSLI
jgi:hypothetical protein